MHDYRYALINGDKTVAMLHLSEVAEWATRREERKFFDLFPDCKEYGAVTDDLKAVRIGSRKRLRGLMQAAGWQRNDINFIIGQLREKSYEGWSAQLLWYAIVSSALEKKAIREHFPRGLECIEDSFQATMSDDEVRAFEDAIRKG